MYVVTRKFESEQEKAMGFSSNKRITCVVRVNSEQLARTMGAQELGVPEHEVDVHPYPTAGGGHAET